MATEFTATVQAAGGDYTALVSAEAGLNNDLTAATIKVFSISAASSPTIAAGDAVTGNTSGATGTCVLVNAVRTQILIKAITGTFSSGETVQKTGDPTKTVALSNAGDSPIIGIACGGILDTTVVIFSSAWITNATNYFRVYPQAGAEAKMPYNTTTSYRLEAFVEDGGNASLIAVRTNFGRIERLQFKPTPYPYAHTAWTLNSSVASGAASVRFLQCVVQGFADATDIGDHYCFGIFTTNNTTVIVDCVGYNFSSQFVSAGGFARIDTSGHRIYNNTMYNLINGLQGSNVRAKNNLYDQAGQSTHTGYLGTYNAASTNNASTDATSAGSNPRINQTFTYINAAGGDFHIAGSDLGARSFGADLSADAQFPFSFDFDNLTRTTPWDIGATKFESLIKTVDNLAHDSNKTVNGIPINQVRQRDGLS